jgi:hypothetical protein
VKLSVDIVLEAMGTSLGVSGAILMALKLPVLGFGFWIAGNLLWILWANRKKARLQVAMWIIYTITSVMGLLNWSL